MKILIIEDEILILRSLQKLLQKKGFEVDTTTSGKEGIHKIQNNKYDRIITDLMLQDISGFDILEESKKQFSLEEISRLFFIITAYSSPQVLSKAQEYGCQVVNKPFMNIQETIELFTRI